MSVKEIKALERRWFEESNKGKAAAMAVIDELHVTDYVFQWHRRGYTRPQELQTIHKEVLQRLPRPSFNH